MKPMTASQQDNGGHGHFDANFLPERALFSG